MHLKINMYKFEKVRGFDSLWSNCGYSLTNPSGRTTNMESTQSLNRNEYQVFPGVQRRSVCRPETLRP